MGHFWDWCKQYSKNPWNYPSLFKYVNQYWNVGLRVIVVIPFGRQIEGVIRNRPANTYQVSGVYELLFRISYLQMEGTIYETEIRKHWRVQSSINPRYKMLVPRSVFETPLLFDRNWPVPVTSTPAEQRPVSDLHTWQFSSAGTGTDEMMFTANCNAKRPPGKLPNGP